MPEQLRALLDIEAGHRYERVVDAEANTFTGSNLLTVGVQITDADLKLIAKFHSQVSPTNPGHPYRLQKPTYTDEDFGHRITDVSFFGNWESSGGPLEHIEQATAAAAEILQILQSRLRQPEENQPQWQNDAVDVIQRSYPNFVAAAAALHDDGRLVTHIYWTNELIGSALHRRIGIRPDLMSIMPREDVMQVPLDLNMDSKIQSLPPLAVIVRLADEFGKRAPMTNRLYMPKDYDSWDRNAWAKGYIEKSESGRPSDKTMRERMQLHVDNVPRYFQALDNWVRAVSTLTLEELCQKLSEKLSPGLPQIQAPKAH